MENLFLTVLGMSGTASVVIAAVLLARLALRRAPRVFSYALWAVVLFRLLCPVTIESAFSLLPCVRMVDAAGRGGGTDQVLQVRTGIPALNSQVNGFLADHPYQEGQPMLVGGAPEENLAPVINQLGPVPDWRTVPAAVWLAGTVLLLGYGVLSLLRLRRGIAGSIPLEGEKNVRLADHIPSPFVLGLFRPRIYLPSGLPEGERNYILLHERTHIRRLDHATRALAWLALALHWFNPLAWLAFHLAGKDMEMSCDEAVLRKMGRDIRADYSSSLLRLSQGGRLPAGPLAFGGGDPQSRIKNVLGYKKPALWVMAAALILVLCTGAALATDPGDRTIIDPASVSSVSVSARTFLNTEYVSHTARRDDLFDPDSPYVQTLSQEEGMELVHLINSYSKSVFYRGDPKGDGLDDWVRIDCSDGGFYLLHYYYWSSVCLNPFHPGHGEDDYVTLVTRCDAQGNAGTTWRMECEFDQAFLGWRPGAKKPDGAGVNGPPDDTAPEDDLTFSVERSESGQPFVRLNGSVGGYPLERNAIWYTGGMEELYDGHSQALSMSYRFSGGGAELSAWWADEAHTAVTLSTRMSTMLSSYMPVGYWEFTVDLSGETAVLAVMEARTGESTIDAPLRMCPEAITETEAVQAARTAAKLMTAAEDVYRNSLPLRHPDGALAPQFYTGEFGECLVGGLGNIHVEWHPPRPLTPLSAIMYSVTGWLYLAGDPAALCPPLAGRTVEGDAQWTDADKTAVQVGFNVSDARVVSGTVCGFRVRFTVDLERRTVTDRSFESMVEGETLELTDQEMLDMAQAVTQVLEGAEAYFYDASPSAAPN